MYPVQIISTAHYSLKAVSLQKTSTMGITGGRYNTRMERRGGEEPLIAQVHMAVNQQVHPPNDLLNIPSTKNFTRIRSKWKRVRI